MADQSFAGILRFLGNDLELTSQVDQAGALGLNQPQVSKYRDAPPKTATWWRKIAGRIYNRGYRDGKRDITARMMAALVETFGQIPQSELAQALGVTQPAVSGWLRGTVAPSKANFEALLGLHVLRLVEPLVEFHPIQPTKSSSAWHFFGKPSNEKALRDVLRGRIGIYVFYDSSGRVTYLGKTESCLWSEPKQRLKATVNRTFYNPTKKAGVQQGEVTRFLSAYEVRLSDAIHNLEVLMLRAIPNDSANTNVGKFKTRL